MLTPEIVTKAKYEADVWFLLRQNINIKGNLKNFKKIDKVFWVIWHISKLPPDFTFEFGDAYLSKKVEHLRYFEGSQKICGKKSNISWDGFTLV